MVTIKYWGTAT